MKNQDFLLPLPPDLPSFETAMEVLNRVPLVIVQALDSAASKTAAYRDAECPGEALDAGLAATLMRFHARRFLASKNITAQLDEEDDWSLEQLPFMGMSFHYNGYHVRVLKGPSGELPGCGRSERKIAFYNQVPRMYLVGNTPKKALANVLVLWDLNATYGLSGPWLALPAVGGMRIEDVSAFWCKRIPDPAEGLRGIPEPPTPPDGDLSDIFVPIYDDKSRKQAK